MNEIDKKAFSDAAKDWATKSAGKDLGEYFWQAALAHRDAQPAQVQQEVVHWRAVLTNGGKGEDLPVPKVMGFTDESMAKNKISEMKDFKGWDYRLEALYTTPPAARSANNPMLCIACGSPTHHLGNVCFGCGKKGIKGSVDLSALSTPPAAPDAELLKALELLTDVVVAKNRAGAEWGEFMGQLLHALAMSQAALAKHGGAA